MAPWLLAMAYEAFGRLRHIWADMAYRGQRLRAWVEDECGWTLEIVERPRRWGWYPIDVEPPADAGLHGVAAPVGGGTDDRLGWPVPPPE